MSHRDILDGYLAGYRKRYPAETAVVDRFERLLDAHPRCFHRDCWAGHVTGSAWLVDASRSRVLLTHHRKLGRWLQLGGHSDGDPDPLRVAVREAEEESGLRVRPVTHAALDLDVHVIPARRAEPAHYHFDVRFLLTVTGSEAFVVSGESHDLAWVDVDRIPEYTAEISILRLARKSSAWV